MAARKGESREAYLARRRAYDRLYEHRRNIEAKQRGYTSRAQERHAREVVKKELGLDRLPEPRSRQQLERELQQRIVHKPEPSEDQLRARLNEREQELARLIELLGVSFEDIWRFEGDWEAWMREVRAAYGQKV